MLGPSVDCVMRFLDDDRTGNSIRLEFVERLSNYGRLAPVGGFAHQSANGFLVFERLLVAAVHFDKKMRA